ncbi:hypothetical protein MMPV_003261 [Pyropia vietnamensis]
MAEREAEPSGSDRGAAGSSLYGATDSAASSARADDESLTAAGGGGGSRGSGGGGGGGRDGDGGDGSVTDLEVEGGDLETGLLGAAAAAAAMGVATGTENGEAEAGEKKGKKGKKGKKAKKPQMKDDIKTSMASERTFFKWIWTGFHIGGVGTFILGFFSSDSGYWRLSLVAFTWLVAFGGIFYGLAQFYRRRAALRDGRLEPEAWENAHAPAIVVAMFTVVISSVLVFAVATA